MNVKLLTHWADYTDNAITDIADHETRLAVYSALVKVNMNFNTATANAPYVALEIVAKND